VPPESTGSSPAHPDQEHLAIQEDFVAAGFKRDALVSLGVFVLLVVHGIRVNTPDPGAGNLSFGYEYGRIAASLARGQGYANPFETDSGPTAWMPPLLPSLIAVVFKVFGVRTLASLWVLLILKFAALALTVFLLLRLAEGAGFRKCRYLLFPILALPVHYHREWFFRIYMDLWIISLLVTYLTYALFRQLSGERPGTFVNLLVLAVVLPLTSPGLAMAFVVFELGYGVRVLLRRDDIGACMGLARVALLLTVFAASLAPWTLRNYLVFGRFIPIKSNAGFELGQSALDDDGLITIGDFGRLNPGGSARRQREVALTGEVAYNDRQREIFLERLRQDPMDEIRKVLRRARNAFLYTRSPFDIAPMTAHLEDAAVLERRELIGLAAARLRVWTCLRWTEARFVKTLATLPVRTPSRVADAWRAARGRLRTEDSSPGAIGASLIVSLVPTLALLFVLLSSWRRHPAVIAATVVYLLYLAPYVLVVHYLRYQLPLIPLQAFFIFLCLVLLLERGRRARAGESEPGNRALASPMKGRSF